jgi:hypothetical protein
VPQVVWDDFASPLSGNPYAQLLRRLRVDRHYGEWRTRE